MFMRMLILLVAVSISFTANSQDPYGLIDPQRFEVPACEVFGKDVQFRVAPTSYFAANNTLLALASISNDGNLAVWVDSTNFFSYRVTPEFQQFILYHECGHHTLGHVATANATASYRGQDPAWEPAADCFAIKRLRQDGYTSVEFDTILEQASDINLTKALAPYFTPYTQIAIDESGHSERVAELKQCIENPND